MELSPQNNLLEHFHQSCSDERNSGAAVFLVFGFVSAQSKILAAHRYIFSVNALNSGLIE